MFLSLLVYIEVSTLMAFFLNKKYSRNVQAAARVAVHNVLAHNVPFLMECFWNKRYLMKLIFSRFEVRLFLDETCQVAPEQV